MKRVEVRSHRLMVDVFVALAEMGCLTDEDIELIKQNGIGDQVKDKLFTRAEKGVDAFMDEPLAWEARDN